VLLKCLVPESPMAATVVDDPVLFRVRQALDAMYGDEIERVVLFGSRARGDVRIEVELRVGLPQA
jgi:hypothetical protein